MRVVILAAGKGSRLGQGDLPKPLTMLSTGKSILEQQLDHLRPHVSLEQVLIVVGYHQEAIIAQFSEPKYLENPCYAEENTSKSLLKALKVCHEDVLWMNGDVVFHPSVLKAVLDAPKTSMVVNVGQVGEEEVKYRKDAQGLILEVSKQVENPHGEALGINYVSQKDLPLLIQELEKCAPGDYFERGIEGCIESGMQVWSVPVDVSLCAEIDFPEDLEKANAMLQRWKS